jgi:hypothetical protein
MKMGMFEQVKDAGTPAEMRAEIFRLQHYDPLVRKVMDNANYNGISSEDKYMFLAYHALRERAVLQSHLLEYVNNTLPPLIYLDTESLKP